jgi:Uma2 family endonuclease
MRVPTEPRALTADEVFNLPAPPYEMLGYECVDGQPVPVMPASLTHGWMNGEVYGRLRNHVIEHDLPGRVCIDCAFRLGLEHDPERMRAADVSYIAREKLEGVNPDRLLRVMPELAIEIDLNSDKKPGGQQRIVDYLKAGIPLVWAIDPLSRTAMSYRPDGSARFHHGDDVLDAEEVVPGFRLPLAELFAQAP